MHSSRAQVVAILLLGVGASVLLAQENSPAPDQPAVAHREARYPLSISDVIAVTFPLTPEFDQTVTVRPDGFVTLAGAGDVHVQGLNPDESAAAIRTAYAKILNDPIVTVELRDFRKPYFSVSGQVNRPGRYDLHGTMLATEAIAIAGGFNDAAKHSQVLLFRQVNDSWFEVKPLDMKKILQGREIDEDPEIRSGDLLFVPQNALSKLKRFIPSSGVGAYYQLHP